MACIRPISSKTAKGKNITFPCGVCRECRIQFVKDWSLRLSEELKTAKNAYFITLTYAQNPEKLEKSHIRAFIKDLRNFVNWQYQTTKKGKKVSLIEKNDRILRFFCVGEFGDKFGRPHWHMLLFNIPVFLEKSNNIFLQHREVEDLIQQKWPYGLIDIGSVTKQSINYVCKYIFKEKSSTERLQSRGIGEIYLQTILNFHNTDTGRHYYTFGGGIKTHLPKYYSDKLFSDAEKEVHKFNELERQKKIHKEYSQLSTEERLAELDVYWTKHDQKEYTHKHQKR